MSGTGALAVCAFCAVPAKCGDARGMTCVMDRTTNRPTA
jgi:hypothetical protein